VLYALFMSLQALVPEFNLFRYITVRPRWPESRPWLDPCLRPGFYPDAPRFQIARTSAPKGPNPISANKGRRPWGPSDHPFHDRSFPPLGKHGQCLYPLDDGTMISFGAIGFSTIT